MLVSYKKKRGGAAMGGVRVSTIFNDKPYEKEGGGKKQE